MRIPPGTTHYHEGKPDGLCGKKVRPKGVATSRRCSRNRDHIVHKYYRCEVNLVCAARKFWSIEHLMRHKEEKHSAT